LALTTHACLPSAVADSLISTLSNNADLAYSKWVRCFDEASDQWFFFNQVTNETQWDKPTDFKSGDGSGDNGGSDDDPFVAVIVEHRPLCARCFKKKRPLHRSKSFLCVFFLALVGVLAGLILANSDCPTVIDRSDDAVTTTTNMTVTSNVSVEVTMVSDVDLVFLYDKSTSVSVANVIVEQDFIEGMIRAFNATLSAKGKLRAAVVSFECATTEEAGLTDDLEGVIAAVRASGTARGGCVSTINYLPLRHSTFQTILNNALVNFVSRRERTRPWRTFGPWSTPWPARKRGSGPSRWPSCSRTGPYFPPSTGPQPCPTPR